MNFLSIAQALIRCPSVTPEDAGVLDTLAGYLKPLGFEVHRVRFDGDGSPPVDNLFARLGTSAPHFCFAGHTDVVPIGDRMAWSVDPFGGEEKDGFLYGRGAEDMKGAIGCMVAAVARLVQDEDVVRDTWNVAKKEAARSTFHVPRLSGSISFLITNDEEGVAINGTRKMIAWLCENGHVPDVCLVGEPTNVEKVGDMVKLGRRGSVNFRLTVSGKQGHVAYPHLADNPVARMIDILHALSHAQLDSGTDFFPPSNLEVVSVDVGNPASNVIPAEAHARFNIRFNDLHSSKSLIEWVHDVCKTHSPAYTLGVHVTGEAFHTEPGPFTECVKGAIREVTGHEPQLSTTGGTSDARFIKDLCPVLEFGTTGKRSHMVDERVEVKDLAVLTECYSEILRRFFKM